MRFKSCAAHAMHTAAADVALEAQMQPANVSTREHNKALPNQWYAGYVQADGGARRARRRVTQRWQQREDGICSTCRHGLSRFGGCIPRVWPLYCPLSAAHIRTEVPEGLAESKNEMLSQLISTSEGY